MATQEPGPEDNRGGIQLADYGEIVPQLPDDEAKGIFRFSPNGLMRRVEAMLKELDTVESRANLLYRLRSHVSRFSTIVNVAEAIDFFKSRDDYLKAAVLYIDHSEQFIQDLIGHSVDEELLRKALPQALAAVDYGTAEGIANGLGLDEERIKYRRLWEQMVIFDSLESDGGGKLIRKEAVQYKLCGADLDRVLGFPDANKDLVVLEAVENPQVSSA